MEAKLVEPAPLGDVSTGCRYMHGEATGRNFCGAKTETAVSWCAYHTRLVYAPTPGAYKRIERLARVVA